MGRPRPASDRIHGYGHGRNIGALLRGEGAEGRGHLNAVCLADFGDSGVAFVAEPQIPPRNINWASEGMWVHLAKVAYEKYFLRKMRRGESEPFYEKFIMDRLGIRRSTRRPAASGVPPCRRRTACRSRR